MNDVVTWARIQAPIGNNNSAYTGGTNNVHYNYAGFKTSYGTLIRTDYNPWQGYVDFPQFQWDDDNGIFRMPLQDIYGVITTEDRDQLIGETVTFTSGSLVIDASAFTSAGQSTGTPFLGTITAIGKLTAF